LKDQKQKQAVKVSVIGGGSWATAIVKLLSHNGHELRWWLRQPETVEYIREYGHNPKYLSSVQLDLPAEQVTYDLKSAIKHADYIIIAVPSAYLVSTLNDISPEDFKGKNIISAVKGMILEENMPVSQYFHKKWHIPYEQLANISGPCHAEEVAAEKLSYLTFSSPNHELADKLAEMFRTRFMRTLACDDLIGTEYASVLKNIYAIAAGIAVGLGYGDNFRAVLVSKAMSEMLYFIDTIKAKHRNILSSAYLGDTLVTAYSLYSRNRTFGTMIGKGYTINAAILELNMVAEGYYASQAVKAVAKEHNLDMPIADTVYGILYDHLPPAHEFAELAEKLN
jgi:glycerol-3-phosphate dehydrogenase (NAD(P)+)